MFQVKLNLIFKIFPLHFVLLLKGKELLFKIGKILHQFENLQYVEAVALQCTCNCKTVKNEAIN